MRPDSLSLKAIGGDLLLESLELSTPYGRHHLEMTDYSNLPKQECVHHYQRIDQMLTYFLRHPQRFETLKSRLSEIESIDSILDHLSRPEIPLTLEEIFILKKHLYLTRQLIEELRDTPLSFWGTADPMLSIWQRLDIDGRETPAFEYSGRHHPELEAARDAFRELSRRQTELANQLRREAAAKFQLTTLPERLSLSNRNQSDLIDRLMVSGNFLICEKNFYNTILQLQPTPTQLELRHRQSEIMDRIQRIEEEIRKDLTQIIASWADRIKTNTDWIGSLDLDLARIGYAIRFHAVIPEITDHQIELQQGRLVFFQRQLEQRQWQYQPLELHCMERINVITGMNMGGKSIVLKTIGFLAFHLHLALPVPAVKARLPLFQRIFYSGVETCESSDRLSSFGSEVVRFRDSLNDSIQPLYLMDEFAADTNPIEAASINIGLLRYFSAIRYGWCFASTHLDLSYTQSDWDYWQMAGIPILSPDIILQLQSLSPAERLRQLHQSMDYHLIRLEHHQSPPHHATAVAASLGLPIEILNLIPPSEPDNPQHIQENHQQSDRSQISDTDNP